MTPTKAKDLQLGDTIRTGPIGEFTGPIGEFMDATVVNITTTIVHCVRPYVHTADFSYTGGALWYLGVENYDLVIDSDQEVILLSRKKLSYDGF